MVSVGGSVSVGVRVAVKAVVIVGDTDVSIAPIVAVTTIICGEGQSHCKFGSGVSVGVCVIVAVGEAVGVMLGVKVGVLVLRSTNTGNSGLPMNTTYREAPNVMRKIKPLLTSANVKGNLRSRRR